MNEVVISPIIASNHYTEGYDSLSDEEAAAFAKVTRQSVRATKAKDSSGHPQRPPRLRPVRDPLDSDDELFLDEKPVRTNRKDFSGMGGMNGASKPDVSLADFLKTTTPDGFTPPPPRRSSMMPTKQKPSKNTFDEEPLPTNNKLMSSSRSVKSTMDDDDDLEFGVPKRKAKTETSDLAEFLKSTGPAESPEIRYSSDRSSYRGSEKQNKWLSPLIGGLWKRPNSTIISPSNSTPVSPTRPKSKYVPLIPSPSSSESYNGGTPRFSQSSSQLSTIDQSKPLPPSPIHMRHTNSVRSTTSHYPPSPKSSLTRHPSENGSISTIGVMREFESEQLEAMRQLQETSLTQIKALEQLIKQQQQQILESRVVPPQPTGTTEKGREMFVQTDGMETYTIHTQTHPETNDSSATLDFLNVLEPTEDEVVNLQTENAYLKSAIHALQKKLVYERRANEMLAASMADNTRKFEQLSIIACEKFAELWNEKCDWEEEAIELRGRVDALLDVQGVDTVGSLEIKVSPGLMVNDMRSKRRSYFA